MNKILFNLKVFWLVLTVWFRKTYIANVCKHKTKRTGKLVSQGKAYIMALPLSENKNPDYCLKCISKMSIRCAWCGKPIDIGSPVTLYVPLETFQVPEYAVRYTDDPRCLVGCLRIGCANSGMDRCGFWYPPGVVYRVPSPMELLMSPDAEGKMLIIHDLSNPNDIGELV